ncbi:WD40-repeat-containing domain protein [Gilbertella persicaria]|uniref:WD40-repeat-containing domain protein n=1 Tax=Gilbertella persicaria TaxID=101096 RepID=UPI0022210B8F|nr:WD40-repeat-containing domain protein [Gilbertella persicaria]KAI8059417.1 WD40-repeat-containing domain protein [Gilbertella persicaria]
MVKVTSEYISIGCNRSAHAACWGNNGLVAFGADALIALYSPLNEHSKGVKETIPGHKGRVICLKFIERGNKTDINDIALVSGSADCTAKIWKTDATGKWINSATLEGHTGSIETIACMRAQSIDTEQDLIVTGSSDGTIRIWKRSIVDENTDQVTCVQTISNGNKYPMSLALSYLPESKTPILASGHTDKLISIYAQQSGKFEKMHVLQGHDNWVRDLAFATYTATENDGNNQFFQEGDLMLASASQDKYIRLWKISAHIPATAKPSSVESPQADENDLSEALKKVNYEQLSTKAHLITVDNRPYSLMFEALLMGHDDWVFSVEWQRPFLQGDRLVQPLRLISASIDKSMMIWSPDADTGVWVNESRMGDIGGSTYLGFCGALFSPDGKSIISHGANGSFHLWKEQTEGHWAPEVAISGHFKSVESIAWDPHSRFLLSASLDQTTRLFAPWNRQQITTWHEMGRPQVHGYDIKCIAFVHDWQFVSGADEKVLRVFDAPRSCVESLAALTGNEAILVGIENRPVGANLPALGLSNKAVFEGDTVSQEQHQEVGSHSATAASAETLAQVMQHPPYEEQLLQHTLWPEVEKLYGHSYELMAVHTTHNGQYIASACKAANQEYAVVRLFDTKHWKEVPTKIDAHALTVTRVQFSHNDRWLLTVSRDRLWSISERTQDPETPYRLVAKSKAHARIIWDCSWSHDDKLFVTGSRDKTLKVWTSENWECVATIKCEEAITAVDFAPIAVNGRQVIK